MTKKEAKARKYAYTLALKEGRVVRYNDGNSFRSFATVADAQTFEATIKATGLDANIVVVPADYYPEVKDALLSGWNGETARRRVGGTFGS